MEKLKKIARLAIPAALALPLLALAVAEPILPGGSAITLDKIADILTTVANWLIIVGVIIAVIMIIWGGLKWMYARGDEAESTKAKESIKHGIYGALIVLGVGVIIRTLSAVVLRSFFGAGQ